MIRSRAAVLLLAGLALLYMLMALSVWLKVPSFPPDGVSSSVPIGPGHTIIFTYWTHDLAFSTKVTTGGLTRQHPGPLRLTIWYKHPPAGKQEHLVVLRIRVWPLMAIAAIAAVASLCLWRGASSNTRHAPCERPISRD